MLIEDDLKMNFKLNVGHAEIIKVIRDKIAFIANAESTEVVLLRHDGQPLDEQFIMSPFRTRIGDFIADGGVVKDILKGYDVVIPVKFIIMPEIGSLRKVLYE